MDATAEVDFRKLLRDVLRGAVIEAAAAAADSSTQ
jgi:hypothetical protein